MTARLFSICQGTGNIWGGGQFRRCPGCAACASVISAKAAQSLERIQLEAHDRRLCRRMYAKSALFGALSSVGLAACSVEVDQIAWFDIGVVLGMFIKS